MDIFGWLESSVDAEKWASVAEQAGVILAALDDVDVLDTFIRICNEVSARFDDGDRFNLEVDCEGASAEISEMRLLEVQVFFDVARATADKVAVALHG